MDCHCGIKDQDALRRLIGRLGEFEAIFIDRSLNQTPRRGSRVIERLKSKRVKGWSLHKIVARRQLAREETAVKRSASAPKGPERDNIR